jgi:hypothetical protein
VDPRALERTLLPHPLLPSERLRAYASWCNAVEGNTTFYAMPARSTVETWTAQTGPDFRLVLKLPRTITHERRSTGVDDELGTFLTAMEPLGPRNHAFPSTPSLSSSARRPATPSARRRPRVLRWSRALTEYPIVRCIGRDDIDLTVEGGGYLVAAVVDWLREVARRPCFSTPPTTSRSSGPIPTREGRSYAEPVQGL